ARANRWRTRPGVSLDENIPFLWTVGLPMVSIPAHPIEMTRGELAVRWLDRLLLAELVGLTFLLGCFLDKDADIWWHLRAGREILGGRGIPRTDSYLFSTAGAEWIDLHWGFQAAAAWIFAHGGFRALTVAAAVTAAC